MDIQKRIELILSHFTNNHTKLKISLEQTINRKIENQSLDTYLYEIDVALARFILAEQKLSTLNKIINETKPTKHDVTTNE